MLKKLLKTILVTSSFKFEWILVATLIVLGGQVKSVAIAKTTSAVKGAAESPFLRHVGSCAKTMSPVNVYLIKQWHLGSEVNTSNMPEEEVKKIPQYANQLDAYEAISLWNDKGNTIIDTAIAEGCEGEINPSTTQAFNGWNYQMLDQLVGNKKYPQILTHVILKTEVEQRSGLKSLCGDNLAQIKVAQLALSDIRASLGYDQRLKENEKNPTKLKIYLEGVIDSYQLPKSSTLKQARAALKAEARASFMRFVAANSERNTSVVQAIKNSNSAKPILVLFGGLHAADLKAKFQAEKWNCEIYEPKSYQNNEEKLLNDFKKITL